MSTIEELPPQYRKMLRYFSEIHSETNWIASQFRGIVNQYPNAQFSIEVMDGVFAIRLQLQKLVDGLEADFDRPSLHVLARQIEASVIEAHTSLAVERIRLCSYLLHTDKLDVGRVEYGVAGDDVEKEINALAGEMHRLPQSIVKLLSQDGLSAVFARFRDLHTSISAAFSSAERLKESFHLASISRSKRTKLLIATMVSVNIIVLSLLAWITLGAF